MKTTRKNRTTRCLSFFLTLVMLSSAFVGIFSLTASAIDMQAGIPTFEVNTASPTIIGFGGKQWAVIGHKDDINSSQLDTITLFLTNGYSYGASAFNSSGSSNEYSGSTLQTAMDTAYNSLLTKEKGLVNNRVLLSGSSNYNGGFYMPNYIKGPQVYNAKFWPLSVAEAQLLHPQLLDFTDSSWWLRSPGSVNSAAAGVINSPSGPIIIPSGADVASPTGSVRPAFNLLYPSSTLFTSAAEGGKSSATVGGAFVETTATSGAVKFTMQDSQNIWAPVLTLESTTNNSPNISFTYSGAETGLNQYVSCVLEQNGEVKYYGKLADCERSANGTFTIPVAGIEAGNYNLKIFCEQANGDNYTDFAGASVDGITLSVARTNGTISGTGFNKTCDCCENHNHGSDFFSQIACFFCRFWQSILRLFSVR